MNINATAPINHTLSITEKRKKKDEIKVAKVLEMEGDCRQDSFSYTCYENAYQAYKKLGDEYSKKIL